MLFTHQFLFSFFYLNNLFSNFTFVLLFCRDLIFFKIFFLVLGSIPSVRNFSFAASSAYCQPTPEEVPYETKDIVMM